MKISVVLPVHNEAEYLPYSLASLKGAPIDELVVVLDRCRDGSMEIVERFCNLNPRFYVKVIDKNWQDWKFPTGEVFEIGFSVAEGDLIYTMAADIYIDQRIYSPRFFEDYDIVSFYYHNFDLKYGLPQQLHQWYLNFLKKHFPTLRSFSEFGKRSGIFGIKRDVWEHVHWSDVPSPDTELFINLYRRGFKHRYVADVNSLHLRVGLLKDRQFLQGLHRAYHRVHWLKVFLHSLVYVKPYVFTAYQLGRRYGTFERERLPHVT